MRYFFTKTITFLVSIIFLVSITFLLMRILPGDPAVRLAGIDTSAEVLGRIQNRIGTNATIFEQYLQWVQALVRFDFGTSIIYQMPVSSILSEALASTLLLACTAFIGSVLFSIFCVLISFYSPAMRIVVQFFETLFLVIPLFWLGTLCIIIFSAYTNTISIYRSSIVLPLVCLTLANSPLLIRHLRIALEEEMKKPYIQFTHSCGFSRTYCLVTAAMPNASIAFIHLAAVQFGYLLGGNIIIESIFSRPGLGTVLLQGIFNRDYPVVQACVLAFGIVFVACMYAADLMLYVVNPRLRKRVILS